VDVDQAARVHAAPQPQAAVDPLGRQGPQCGPLGGGAVAAAGVPCGYQGVQEGDVLAPAGEVPAAPQPQGLIDGGLEVPVGRLVVPVLVRGPHVDPLARQPVVFEQVPIPGLELPLRRQVADRRREAVAAVPPGHPAECPQGVLEPVRQRLKRLRRTHRHRLPVRVRQDEVVHQVVERLALDGHGEWAHGREVGGRKIAGLVHLAEHRLPARAGRGPPGPHPPLERPPVAVVEPPGVLGLDPVEQGLGLEPGFGRQPARDRRPDVGERVRTGAIRPGLTGRAGQGAPGAVLACGLVVHARPPGGSCQRRSRVQIAEQPADLGIRDHGTPPTSRRGELAGSPRNAKRESWRSGVLVVAGREK
jgi:hypothetical protein